MATYSNPQVGEEGLTATPGYPPQEQGISEEGGKLSLIKQKVTVCIYRFM